MIVWKYLDSLASQVKHAFYDESRVSAMCGQRPVWYGGLWKTDEEELKKRRECKLCLKFLEN